MADATDTAVMEARVALALRMLADGAYAEQVLEDLWRGGYACGVRKGQQPAPGPGFMRKLEEETGYRLGLKVPAPGHQWSWAPGPLHLARFSGSMFRFGGMEPREPAVDRPATVEGREKPKLVLLDTGERVPWPQGSFWAREDPTGKGAAPDE